MYSRLVKLTKPLKLIFLSALLFLTTLAEAQRLVINDQEIFINGINLPWRFYGQDFGRARDGKHYYEAKYYEFVFDRLKQSEVNTVRIWLHCQGKHSPLVDQEVMVRDLPSGFIEEFSDFLELAARYELMVIPVLWSFEMVDHGRAELITQYDHTISYIENALIPLIRSTRNHCNILAWEIMNEPEWAMDIPFAGTMKNTVAPGRDATIYRHVCRGNPQLFQSHGNGWIGRIAFYE